MKVKHTAFFLLSIFLLAGTAHAAYPSKPINGIIPFGAGGGVDISARTSAPQAANMLGQSIIMQNRPGATGAVGLTATFNLPADGYTILFHAENPTLYKVLGLSRLDYSNFDPVILLMSNPGLIIVPKESPYNSFQEFVAAAKDGKRINMGSAGLGSLAHVAATMIEKVHGLKFNQVQFDGEGPGVTVIMGNHIDGMVVGLISAVPYVLSGSVKCLAVISKERLSSLPDVPAITEAFPGDYDNYLPWGPFYGVYVKKGTPEETLAKLRAAFAEACNSDLFKKFVEDVGGIRLSITGDEATAFIEHHQSISAWLLYDSGGAKFSPADFGIKRVGAQ